MRKEQESPLSLLDRPESQWRQERLESANKPLKLIAAVLPETRLSISRIYEEPEVVYASRVRAPVDQTSNSRRPIYDTPINLLKSYRLGQEEQLSGYKQTKQAGQQQQREEFVQPSFKKKEKTSDMRDEETKKQTNLSQSKTISPDQ